MHPTSSVGDIDGEREIVDTSIRGSTRFCGVFGLSKSAVHPGLAIIGMVVLVRWAVRLAYHRHLPEQRPSRRSEGSRTLSFKYLPTAQEGDADLCERAPFSRSDCLLPSILRRRTSSGVDLAPGDVHSWRRLRIRSLRTSEQVDVPNRHTP